MSDDGGGGTGARGGGGVVCAPRARSISPAMVRFAPRAFMRSSRVRGLDCVDCEGTACGVAGRGVVRTVGSGAGGGTARSDVVATGAGVGAGVPETGAGAGVGGGTLGRSSNFSFASMLAPGTIGSSPDFISIS